MKKLAPAALAVSFALVGCGENAPTAPPDPATNGGGGNPTPAAPAVGAAYANAGDSRIILINDAGTRFVYYTPADASFSGSRSVSELESGNPLNTVGAVAHGYNGSAEQTYFVTKDGVQVASYDRQTATFLPTEDFSEQFDDSPFPKVGAAFAAGDQMFFFDEGGTRYTAYNTATETWSQVYDFATEFGAGGAPISAVGAAYEQGNGFVLFDLSGTNYTIYSGSGQFSAAFDLDELGDGTLSF